MKSKSLLLCAVALATGSAVSAQEIKLNIPGKTDAPAATTAQPAPATAPAATPAATAPAAFTDAQLAEEFGWFMAKRVGLAELDFTKEQTDALARGVAAAAGGKDSPYELAKIGPSMDEFVQRKQNLYMEKLKRQGMTESLQFFENIRKRPGVISTPTGLAYEIEKQGEGAGPKTTDTVKVNYTGTLVNGFEFDSSGRHGDQAAEVALDNAIPGWTEGLQKIGKGGKIKLYIPPQLAYGDEGRQGIPPASTLIFEVELLDIKPTPPAPATPAAPQPAPTGK